MTKRKVGGRFTSTGRPILASTALAALLASCIDSDSSGNPPGLADNPSSSNRAGGGADWNLPIDWRVGGPDAEGPAIFGAFGLRLSISPEGEVFVLDGSASEVRVFDATGRFVRQFGRPGQGPGDLENATAMGFDPGGLLWVRERSRYSIFESSGRFVRTVPHELTVSLVNFSDVAFGTDGRIVEQRAMRTGSERTTPDGAVWLEGYMGIPGIGFIRQDFGTGRGDTLPPIVGAVFDRRPSASGPPMLIEGNVGSGGNVAILGLRDLTAFVPDIVFRQIGDSIWFAHSNGSAIFQRTLAGDTIRRYEPTRRPADLSRTEESLIAERVATARRELADWAYGRQVIRALVPLGDGNLLALIEEEPGKPSSLFDVYDATGSLIGSLRLDVPIDWNSPIAVRGNRLAAVTLDDLDVRYVIQATVPPLR